MSYVESFYVIVSLISQEWEKAYWTSEDISIDKMVLICVINDNIINTHPSYLGVYQDESKNESSTKW